MTDRIASITLLCESCGGSYHPINGRASISHYCSTTCRDDGRTKPLRPMTTEEVAWLGGLFDGEGCITLHTRPRSGTTIHLRITLTNTSRAMVERVLAVTGVGFITTRYRSSVKHKPTHDWHTTGRNARAILVLILPWLTSKHTQAQNAIEIMEVARCVATSTSTAARQDRPA